MNIALEEFGFLRNQGSGEMFRNLTEKSNNINFKRSLKFENHFILKKNLTRHVFSKPTVKT